MKKPSRENNGPNLTLYNLLVQMQRKTVGTEPTTLVPWQEAADWRIVVWALIDEMIIAVRIRSFGSIYRFERSLVV